MNLARLLLNILSFIAPSVTVHVDNTLRGARSRQVSRNGAPYEKCVVFHSQHKSAGMMVENNLFWIPQNGSGLTAREWHATRDCKLRCDMETWDCEAQSCSAQVDYSCQSGGSGTRIAYRGYTPVLSGTADWGSPGDGKCTWLTMSRDPVARLVSSYTYCKNFWNKDPLCGYERLDAQTASLQDWAYHWGNYLFRELLWHPELHKLATSRKTCSQDGYDCNRRPKDSPWVQFKDQLDGGDDPHTEDGALNLQAVKEALTSKNKPLYDAVGVVEMWNESMALFDEWMPLEGTSWIAAGLLKADHHSGDWADEERENLHKARQDPEVLRALSADIELYNEIILPNFEKYATQHKLTQKAVEAMQAHCAERPDTSPFCDVTEADTKTLLSSVEPVPWLTYQEEWSMMR